MNVLGEPLLLWVTLVTTIAGTALTLAAAVLLVRRAIRSCQDVRARVDAGREASHRHFVMSEQIDHKEQEHQAPPLSHRTPLTGAPIAEFSVSEDRLAAQLAFDARFSAGVGRSSTDASYIDKLLMPELIQLALAEDRIQQLKLPAVLISAGVLTSAVGSVLSLWV